MKDQPITYGVIGVGNTVTNLNMQIRYWEQLILKAAIILISRPPFD
jgi:hypothetical protein